MLVVQHLIMYFQIFLMLQLETIEEFNEKGLYTVLFFILSLLPMHFMLGQSIHEKHSGRPVATYSIVAMDSAAGEIGVAVQSHWFSVGPIVAWGKAGIGVVATQSFVDISYGALGLELMEGGKTAEEALNALIETDEHSEVRQVAMLDVQGNVAAHTGSSCIPEAGDLQGTGYSVQANMMESSEVWPEMSKAFKQTEGDLAQRLITSMQAAEAAGGDIRGKQSAAMLIVKMHPEGPAYQNVVLDLRVDDHEQPLQEMRRLLKLHRAYVHMNNGDLALEEGNVSKALGEYSAAEAMFPENLEMKFWHAVSLVNVERTAEAIPMFRDIFRQDDNWAELLRRLVDAGQIQASDSEVQSIIKKSQ